MGSSFFQSLCLGAVTLAGITCLQADEKLSVGDLHGGLVVQIGANDSDLAVRLSKTGRYLIHLLDADSNRVSKARSSLKSRGIYGLAFAEILASPSHLPYSENVVNGVILQTPSQVPLSEVFRILAPRGILSASAKSKLDQLRQDAD